MLKFDTEKAWPARELAFLAEKGIVLTVPPAVVSFMIQRGFHPRLGARPLRDAVEKFLRGAVADAMLAELSLDHGEFVVCGDGYCCARSRCIRRPVRSPDEPLPICVSGAQASAA